MQISSEPARSHARGPILFAFALLAASPLALPAERLSADIAELRREMQALRAAQDARIAEIRDETASRIALLETRLQELEGGSSTRNVGADAGGARVFGDGPLGDAATVSRTRPHSGTSALQSRAAPAVAGDVRVRFESNTGERGARDRDRTVLRARLRGSHTLSSRWSIGGQLATGDPDDPNSTDTTLSNFVDDLQISLDQAWVRARFGAVQLEGGKFANPFSRTDLVWDADVSPQGINASYEKTLNRVPAKLRLIGLYSPIDEQATGPDGSLRGLQIGLTTADANRRWHFEVAAGYFDYALRSVAGADSGDFRSNALDSTGRRYVSDFDLLDGIAAITWRGLGEAWPLALRVDSVRNLGAASQEDTGYNIEFTLGRAAAAGDWRIGLSSAAVETDAVLAAFSHDNTALATNYRQHTFSVDYVLGSGASLNATWYHYRSLQPSDGGPSAPSDWLDRVRLNVLVSF